MKQNLNPEQTKALVTLEYAEPKGDIYTLGEVLALLPKKINGFPCILDLDRNEIRYNTIKNNVMARGDEFFLQCANYELIDAIFDVLLHIKLVTGANALRFKKGDKVRQKDVPTTISNPILTIEGLTVFDGQLCYTMGSLISPVCAENLELVGLTYHIY